MNEALKDAEVINSATKLYDRKNAVLWARMAGFPVWPARFCQEYEEKSIKTLKSSKVKQVPVLFYGIKCEKGWILESSVVEFKPESLGNFSARKFKTDRDYRAAVTEAIRVTSSASNGNCVYGSPIMDLIKANEHEFPLEKLDWELCTSCGGTTLSGPLMQCQLCNKAQRHWHCFFQQEEGAWVCDSCCKRQGLHPGTIIPYELEENHEINGGSIVTVAGHISSSGDIINSTKISIAPSTNKRNTNSSNDGNQFGFSDISSVISSKGCLIDNNATTAYNSATSSNSLLQKVYSSLSSGNLATNTTSASTSSFRQHNLQQRDRKTIATANNRSKTTSKSIGGTAEDEVGNNSECSGSSGYYNDEDGDGIKSKDNRGSNSFDNVISNKTTSKRSTSSRSASSSSSAEGHNNNSAASSTEIAEATATDDNCFVCGQSGGQLLLCDFPQCTRAYHQVCILKVFPDPIDAASSSDYCYYDNNDDKAISLPSSSFTMTLADPWFCPSHTCIGCHALQSTASDLLLSVKDIPLTFYTNLQQQQQQHKQKIINTDVTATAGTHSSKRNSKRKNNVNNVAEEQCVDNSNNINNPVVLTNKTKLTILQKNLRCCRSCPFSICDDCEEVIRPTTSTGTNNNDRSSSNNIDSDNAALNRKSNRFKVNNGTALKIEMTDNDNCDDNDENDDNFLIEDEKLIYFACGKRSFPAGMECLNCRSKDPVLRLARILERAWVKCANSRLAIPFLRPLLPLQLPPPAAAAASDDYDRNSCKNEKQIDKEQHSIVGSLINDTTTLSSQLSQLPVKPKRKGIRKLRLMNSIKKKINSNDSDVGRHRRMNSDKLSSVPLLFSDSKDSCNINNNIEEETVLQQSDDDDSISCSTEDDDIDGKVNYVTNIIQQRCLKPTAQLQLGTHCCEEDSHKASNSRSTLKSDNKNKKRNRNGECTNRSSNSDDDGIVDISEYKKHSDNDKLLESAINFDKLTATSFASVSSGDSDSSVVVVEDLLAVLEKIRSLQYFSVHAYYKDLNLLRNNLIRKLAVLSCNNHSTSNSTNCILMAFDTIVDASYDYLNKKSLAIEAAETKIRKAATPPITTINNDIPSKHGMMDIPVDSSLPLLSSSKDVICTTTEAQFNNNDDHQILTTTSADVMLRLWRIECEHAIAATVAYYRSQNSNNNNSNVISTNMNNNDGASSSSSPDTTLVGTTTEAAAVLVVPRSLLCWVQFIEKGVMPPQHHSSNPCNSSNIDTRNGQALDPYSVNMQISANEAIHEQQYKAQCVVGEMMMYGYDDDENNSYDTAAATATTDFRKYNDDIEAANLMIGMSRTHRNETISMLEGARTLLSNSNDGCSSSRYKKGNTMNDYVLIGDSCSGSGKGKYTSQQEQRKGLHQWKDDETLVVLDRLKEVTQKALQLETRLREEYIAKQRNVLLTGDDCCDVVTIGQAGLLKELKLANDNLRWRLQQKQHLIVTQKKIIDGLQARLAVME